LEKFTLDRRQISPADRAHAANHDHDKGIADRDQIGRQVGRLARHLQGAAKARQRGAERKDAGE
jgi:hypothetical protein